MAVMIYVVAVTNAWELHKAWPETELYIVPDAGHAAADLALPYN